MNARSTTAREGACRGACNVRPFHGDNVAGRIQFEGKVMATTFENWLPIGAHVVVTRSNDAAAITRVRS